MATVRTSSLSALMIVDVQVGVMADTWEPARVIANIGRALDKARAAGIAIIWVQHHAAGHLDQGSHPWQWVPELQPAADECRIHKGFNSAFEQTTLDQELARLNISHIILAGAATNWCIRATAYGALDRGYDLTLLADAHTTSNLEPKDGHAIQAEDIVRELNIAMTWLSYPARKNTAVHVSEIDFAALS